MAQIDALFNLMFSEKASYLHLSSGNPPILRINGELTQRGRPPRCRSIATMPSPRPG